MNSIFLFFGCSWTLGKFINLIGYPRNPDKGYDEKLQADLYSYRSLISNHFSRKQINYSQGASSNDRQLRLASQHFIGPGSAIQQTCKKIQYKYDLVKDSSWPSIEEIIQTHSLPDEILDELLVKHKINDFEFLRPVKNQQVVLWFITSTARKEFYNSVTESWENVMLSEFAESSEFYRLFLTDHYSHKKELEKLSQQMILWNSYFSSKGITNYWIDTFNHHDYPIHVDNRLNFGTDFSDLMSNLCILTGYTPDKTQYHYSSWQVDDGRSEHLVKLGLLNPQTLHPTQEGHKIIAEKLLVPQLEKIL